MTKRESWLQVAKIAGYHQDSKTFTRAIIEARVNREAMNKEKTMECTHYRVFTRTWWCYNGSGGIVPGAGRRSYRGHPDRLTYDEARTYCQNWNATHKPGRLSRKAEFESA